MVKQTPNMNALVVSAIRNLREVQGSTPREILNYIMSEYNASKSTSDAAVQRKLCTALKRGLDYGILKCVHGHYCLNTDPETVAPMDDMLSPMERGCKSAMRRKRKRRARKGGCKSRSSRRGRKRRASGRKRRRGRRSKCGGRRKSRGRSRRGRKSRAGRRRGHKRSSRRSRRGKSKRRSCRGGNEDIDMLAKDPVENRHRDNVVGGGAGGGYGYERERERSQSRGRQSRSRTRSPSHSRSSGSSDREGNDGNRGGQGE